MPIEPGRSPVSVLNSNYNSWRNSIGIVHSRRITFAWKPGLPGAGDPDPSAVLLAEQIPTEPQNLVLVLQSGYGLTAAVAAGYPDIGRLAAADPNVVAAMATRRSLASNDVAARVTVSTTADARDLAAAGSVDTVLLRLPKGKHRALLSIWSAYQVMKAGGRLFLAGAKQEGIKSYLRHVTDLFGNSAGLAYRKGNRIAQATRLADAYALPAPFQAPWLAQGYFHQFTVDVVGQHLAIHSRPGIFAWDRLDPGSRALIETMQIEPGDDVLDLGCGCGIVGVAAAKVGAGHVTMVDADIDAVLAAERSAAANGVHTWSAQLSDCANAVLDRRFDVVVTNPPFHQGRATDYATGLQFVRDAAKVLRPEGRFYLVANRFLTYEQEMQRHFDVVETAFQDNRFKVLLGRK